MTQLAIYEKKEGREDMKLARYYKGDYTRFQAWKTGVAVTIAYLLLVAVAVIYKLASRQDMIGASMFLCGKDVKTGEYVANSNSCSMCKRLIINSGIDKVFIRDTEDKYRKIHVRDWIEDDESLAGTFGY